MKAIATEKYGSASVLKQQDIAKPTIASDEILVQVHASSVNPVDWKVRKGDVKILTGKKPPQVLGADYAGVVTNIGNAVTDYKVGDAVFGMLDAFKGGAYAEYAKVKGNEVYHKPSTINFEQAASLPLATLTAYQALVHVARMKPGAQLLVNGCTGGVGIAAVQIAKGMGCKITGVCSTKNINLAKQIGVDTVIDYTQESVLKNKDHYDIFFDVVANQTISQAKKTLKSGGFYLTTLPSIQSVVVGRIINLVSSKKVKNIWVKSNSKDLAAIKELVESKQLHTVIEKTYPIEKIQDAHRHSESGRVVGKIVLKVC